MDQTLVAQCTLQMPCFTALYCKVFALTSIDASRVCACVTAQQGSNMRPSPALTCITLVQVICSISIIAITSSLITHPGFGTQKRCYLSSDPHDTGPCTFAYAAAGISLATAALAGCLRCISLNCCGLGPIQSIALAALNCCWWLVAASVLTAAAVAADAAGLPAAQARHLILTAAWVAAITEFVHSIVACLAVGNNVCNILFCVGELPDDQAGCCDSGGCCGGCCRGRRRRRLPAAHEPLLPGAAGAAAAAAAASAFLHRSWWERVQAGGRQQQPRPVTVVTVQHSGPGPAAAAGGYMPPPPTAGQPYLVPPAQAAWAPPPPSGNATGSFGGFPAHPAAGAGTPALVYGLGQGGAPHPTAPAAPPVPQQQQPVYTPPVVMPQMEGAPSDNLYPDIPKQ